MEAAMLRAAELGMAVCDHALLPCGGVIRDCALARRLSLPVIPASAETDAVARDISLCRSTGCRLHIQHISTAGGVELVRSAQREGLPVTAEATPHHLLFTCDDITSDDAGFKMAPPLGNGEDRSELRKAVKDGVLMFATDHAPHPASTKSSGFLTSANGIVGLEVAIAATYAVMVEEEGMDVEAWARAWWELPRWIVAGADAIAGTTRICIDEANPRRVDVASFASLSRNCPYNGMEFSCWPEEVAQ
jgi:dihydroorotase